MSRSRLVFASLCLPAHLLLAQAAPHPDRQWLLGLAPMLVIPGPDILKEGRIGLGTDFQLSHRVGSRTFVGIEVRLGGMGPAMHVRARDNVPLMFDQKNTAENSLSSFAIPVHYFLGSGPIRSYLFASAGYATWGVKTWNERTGESPSLFPTVSTGRFEVAPGIGVVALAHEARRDWYVDLGMRLATAGTVPYLRRSGFASVGGRTVIERTPVNGSVFIFHISATAMLP